MANTVIDQLIVRLIADARQFTDMMKRQVPQATSYGIQRVQQGLNAFGNFVDKTFIKIADRVKAASIQIQRGLRSAFLNAPMYANQALGAMRRAGYNLALGFQRGWHGIGTPVRTLAGRAGRFIGGAASGALAFGGRALGAAGRGASALGTGALHVAGVAGGFAGRALGAAGRGAMGAAGGLAAGFGSVASGAAMAGAAVIGSLGGAFKKLSTIVGSSFSFINSRLRRLGYDLQFLGRRFSLYVTAPIVAMGTAAITAFAKFDEAMTTAVAVMGSAGKAVRDDLEKTVFDLAKTTRTAPTDLALTYYHLASAGYKAADAIGVLATVEKFSVAGAFDLNESGHAAGNSLYAMARASNYLVDTQAALGLRVEDTARNMSNMTRISDVLTQANIISNATVQDFAKALSNKGAAAIRMLNKDMEEGVAVLAAFASQGVKAENAGEKLYIITRDLARATLKHREAWESLGISVFDSGGNMRNLGDIMINMEKAMKGMSDEEKRATMMNLGLQDRSLAATIQLLGLGDAIKKYESALRDADGATKRVADERLKSFTSQMLILKNHINIVAISIGRILAPWILSLNDKLKAATEYWFSLSDTTRQFVVMVAAAAAAIGPFLVSIGILAVSLTTAVSGFVALKGVIAGFIPAIAVFSALGAAVAGLVYLVAGTDGLTAAWNYATDAVKSFVGNAVGFMNHFSENMTEIFNFLSREWFNIIKDFGQILKLTFINMAYNAGVGMNLMVRLFTVSITFMATAARDFFLKDIPKWVATAVINIINKFYQVATIIPGLLAESIHGLSKKTALAVIGFVQQVSQDLGTGVAAGATGSLVDAFKSIWGEEKNKFASPLEGFKSNITKPLKLNLEVPGATLEAGKQIEKIHTDLKDIKDITDEDLSLRFSVKGIDALEAGSAAAMRAFMEFKSTMPGAGAMPKFDTRKEMLASRRKAVAEAPKGRFQKELDRRARMRSFLGEKELHPEKNPDMGPVEMSPDEKMLEAVGLEGKGPSPADKLASSIDALTSAILANTETVSGNPIIELEPSNLGAGG